MATAATNDAEQRALLTVNATGGVGSVSWSASVTDNNPNFGGFGDSGASWTIKIGTTTVATASNQSYDFGANSPARYFPRSESGSVSLAAGTYSVTGTFTTTGLVGTATITPFNVTVTSPVAAPVFSDATVDNTARTRVAYSDGVLASGSPTYSVRNAENTTAGAFLPPGLTLNTSTGAITGTPTTLGQFSFRIRASNSGGSATTAILTITVISAVRVWTGSAFVLGFLNVWNGSSWITGTIKVWDGSAWIDSK
jgi:hypothetical protein